MLTSSLIQPHPALRDFIQSYTACLSDASFVNMSFPLFAHHETSIGFFLGDTSIYIQNHATNIVTESTNKVFLFGVSTYCKETMRSKGNYNTFTIEFKPNGFHKLFGLAASEISDMVLPASEVIGNGVQRLYEQLLHARGAQEMVVFSDEFLIDVLNRKKAVYINEGITKIAYQLLASSEIARIPQYAYKANMSIRNFERKFGEQVGTSPKLYCRLLRFNSALKYKIGNPGINWTEVANEFGYYDHMHLIKEFKKFTNTGPSVLINDNPHFIDNGCYKIRPV